MSALAFRRTSFLAACCGLALLVTSESLAAQRGPASDRLAARGDSASVVRVISTEPVVASGAPRSYLIVSVPVPREVPIQAPVNYRIDPSGAVSVIGRKSGTLESTDGSRAVLVTIGIPARARAGRVLGAWVIFAAAGVPPLEVPVAIDVTEVRGITLTTTSEIRGLVRGDRIDFRYRVRNDGNTRDTVSVALVAPEGWRTRALSEPVIVLEPGAEGERAVRLFVPASSATGDFFLRLDAAGRGARSTATTLVEVVDRATGRSPLGPTLRTAVAAVAGGGAQTSSVASVELNGPLSSSVHVDGRIALPTSNDPVAIRGFARVTSFATTPYLSVWSPSWRLSAGNTPALFTELSGVNAWGTGLSAAYDGAAYGFGVLAARAPRTLSIGSPGELYGASYRADMGPVRLSSVISRLSDGGAGARDLAAYAFGASVAQLPIGALSGEVAYRESTAGTGMGWAAELRKGEARNRIQLSYLHAPGGSAAFARARDQVAGAFNRTLTPRWQVGGAFFVASDSNIAFASMRSHAATLAQQLRLGDATVLSLEARSTAFEAEAGATLGTSFGSAEKRLTGGVALRRGRAGYTAQMGIESVSRSADFENGAASNVSGLRGIWRGTADLVTANGVYQIENGYELSDPSTSFAPHQLTVAARVMQVRVSRLPHDFFLDAEAQYQIWGATRSAVIYRAGVTVPIRGLELSAHAEHNTFFDMPSNGLPWVLSLKVERATNLPRLRLSSSAGYVFQDVNANGLRDAGESGVGNVVVRHGNARAVTDRDGRYAFWDRTRGVPTVETSSLPHGWVLGALPRALRADETDIALVPTASIEVILVLTAEGGRMPVANLTRVSIFARDAQGREWLARRTGHDTAIFDALPTGEYTLDFDFSALVEPLRLRENASFRVNGRSSQQITIPLFGRPLRFFQPRSPAGSRGPGRSPTT